VVYGLVVPTGQGQIPSRQASVKAGIPYDVPVVAINKVCGSSLKAVTMAAQIIKAGDADIVVAGGMESMSNIPYFIKDLRWGARMNDVQAKDAMIHDGLWCPQNNVHMGVIGGSVAQEYNIGRDMQDRWALRSHQRWLKAEGEGKFKDELVPVEITSKKGTVVVDKDESPRPDATLESLQKLRPAFTEDGTITAGNAPGVSDGASALVIMSRDKARELGAPVLAVIKDYAQVSKESRYIATVPGLAIEKLMKKNNLTTDSFDLFEVNEAFASVPLVSCLGILGMSQDAMEAKVNVNGGAVAGGHPIGASGGRILMTLLYEMRRSKKKNGVAAICSGMAQGDAIWVQAE
jgi:acetyl-CoA C-acetyltransferase